MCERDMRTNNTIAQILTPEEWEVVVTEHYSEANQQKRITETVNFVVDHCTKNIANQSAVFRGIWDYLDVDKKHIKIFNAQLKKSLEQSLGAVGRVKIYPADKNSEVELKIVWN